MAGGPSVAMASAIPVTTPGAPAELAATAGNAQVGLSWTAPPSDGGPPVIGYKVYMAATPGLRDSAEVGSTEGTSGSVIGLVNGTTYYFMVAAVNAAGTEGPFSAAVSAEPTRPAGGVTASLTTPAAPKQLIALLAAIAAAAIAGAFTLVMRRRRRLRSPQHDPSQRTQPRSRQPVAAASDVRAVPDTVRRDVVSIRDTGPEATHTVRLEPNPGVITTTYQEGRP